MTMDNFGVFAADKVITTSFDGDAQGEFTVRFRATQSGMLSNLLAVSSRITKAEAYTSNNDRLDVAFRFNGANGATVTGVGFELYQNQPNPQKQNQVKRVTHRVHPLKRIPLDQPQVHLRQNHLL